MKSLRISACVALLAVVAMIALHRNSLAQGGNLRILTPAQGAQLASNVAHVAFELVNRGMDSSSTPTYQLQLDAQDPVQTSATDYTFTGLAPGTHIVTVQAVDANGLPIAGSSGAVQFTVPASARPQSRLGPGVTGQAGAGATLPEAASLLPVLSIIGFGALVGGILTVMRTR